MVLAVETTKTCLDLGLSETMGGDERWEKAETPGRVMD